MIEGTTAPTVIGRPCKKGHTLRYEADRSCVICKREKSRREWLKWKYGLTIQEYDTLLLGQNEKCAICMRPFDETPFVDHCHTTGDVRGLLCRHCNTGLGMFKDDKESLTRAISYLS